MNKNTIITIVVVVVLVIGGYFFFANRGAAPTPSQTATSTTSQPAKASPFAYTDTSSFAPNFLQCSPSELKIPFPGNSTYIVTVFGVANGNCHYAVKVADQKGVALQSGVDCQVPKALITADVLGHLFGADKVAGKETVLAAQNKLQADYCKANQ